MFNIGKLFLQSWWDIPVEYHPTETGKIIINIPGAGGCVGGYMNKYVNFGNYIQEKNVASFVRIPNDRPTEYAQTARAIINFCLENSKEICGVETPEIWLMGFSAGAAAMIVTGWEYPEVTKILAINPFLEIKGLKNEISEFLPEYKGELYIVKGANDEVIGDVAIDYLKHYATNTKELEIHTIPDCDHQLTGETNSKILSQLPEYYFLGKCKVEEFPDGSNGINLLDT